MFTKLQRIVGIALATMLMSSVVFAECTSGGCGDVYIEELYVTSTAGFYIQTSGTETLANCTPDSGVFLYVSDGSARMKEIYATLLAAQLADKKVYIRINEGTSPCTVAYVRLTRQ